MKRSDMVDALTTLLCPIYEPTEEEYKKYYNKADTILKYLEELGMEPPKVTILKNSYDRTTGDYGFQVNQWDEDL